MRFEAREYLEVVLPALLSVSTYPPPRPSLVLQVLVPDLDDCTYHYRFERGAVKAQRGGAEIADMTLSIHERELGELSAGALDWKRAMFARRLRLFGDQEVLKWLSRRLAV